MQSVFVLEECDLRFYYKINYSKNYDYYLQKMSDEELMKINKYCNLEKEWLGFKYDLFIGISEYESMMSLNKQLKI